MMFPSPDKLHILYYPDPILKRVCEPIDPASRLCQSFGPELEAFAQGMLALMHRSEGVGLAAPQVGVAIRLFVCNPTGEPEDNLVCVNPKLSDLQGATEDVEGCLSIPEVDVTMRRSTSARIEAVNTEGIAFQRDGADLIARVWQHEMDHLDGRLIIDNMSATDEIANRRALKQLETGRQADSAGQQAGSAGFTASQRPKGLPRCESPS